MNDSTLVKTNTQNINRIMNVATFNLTYTKIMLQGQSKGYEIILFGIWAMPSNY